MSNLGDVSRFVRVISWNVLLTIAGLGALALAGEAWLRATRPFGGERQPWMFRAGLGWHYAPNSEVRSATVDFDAVSRTNSMGFLDREPPSREAARAGCHVAVVGDSFTVAESQPLANKFHVVFERMAARRLPGLDITTAAYARNSVGQVHQLAFWDKWIRHWSPRLVVLLAVKNDLAENRRRAPNRHTFTVGQAGNGQLALIAPFHYSMPAAGSFVSDLWHRFPPDRRPWALSWTRREMRRLTYAHNPRPISTEDVAYTAWALDQWQERTAQAGVSLLILASTTVHNLRKLPEIKGGGRAIGHFRKMAEERNIPIVDQLAYINATSNESDFDIHWPNDGHWNSRGHQLAAEALLDWVARNSQACTT